MKIKKQSTFKPYKIEIETEADHIQIVEIFEAALQCTPSKFDSLERQSIRMKLEELKEES
jgi:hypothetical protein